jgi:transposase InsO family protein
MRGWKLEIQAAHKRTRGTCGSERLQQELAEQGIKAGVCRIRRIRKKLGLKCKQKKKFKATTDSNHKLPVADNLLDQKFEATHQIGYGYLILPIYRQKRGGCILQDIRIYVAEK